MNYIQLLLIIFILQIIFIFYFHRKQMKVRQMINKIDYEQWKPLTFPKQWIK